VQELALYQEIVNNALAALGARFVNLSGFDRERQEIFTVAWAGGPRHLLQQTIVACRQLIPGFDLTRLRIGVDANPHLRAIHVEGLTVLAPFEAVAEGTTDPRLVAAARRVLGLQYTLAVPLKLRHSVAGSIAFHGPRRFGSAARRTAEAFARQAALTLENTRLSLLQRSQLEELARSREEIARHAAELARSRQRLTEAEERLRRNVAEFLHGRVQTQLLVVWHQFKEVSRLWDTDPARARALLEQSTERLDEIREQELRKASHLLHPSIIRMGLVPAVRSLAARFTDPLRVQVHVGQDLVRLDDPLENRLPEPVRLAAYRVIEEAIANAIRHGQASVVDVWLCVEHPDSQGTVSHLSVRIEDNGRGFDVATLQPGLGLSSVAGRVEQLDGSWEIDSTPGKGTTLSVRLPLRGITPPSARPLSRISSPPAGHAARRPARTAPDLEPDVDGSILQDLTSGGSLPATDHIPSPSSRGTG
jgi:signal transduction histidine kinase